MHLVFKDPHQIYVLLKWELPVSFTFLKAFYMYFFLLKESKHNANEVCNSLRNK